MRYGSFNFLNVTLNADGLFWLCGVYRSKPFWICLRQVFQIHLGIIYSIDCQL